LDFALHRRFGSDKILPDVLTGKGVSAAEKYGGKGGQPASGCVAAVLTLIRAILFAWDRGLG
jgi:hypothetical protein